MVITICAVSATLAIVSICYFAIQCGAARWCAAEATRRLADAQAEVVKLQRMHEGACKRIAAAHDVIARNAERSPLSRLEAWIAAEKEWHAPHIEFTPFGWFVELLLDGNPVVSVFGWPADFGDTVEGVRHLHSGADLGECLAAALDLWQQRGKASAGR